MIKVIYPGSFDPITKGHMNIIEQACNLFDEVIVAIMHNPDKKEHFFTVEERLEIIKEIYKDNSKVKVMAPVGATVDIALEEGCVAIIRGLRSVSDYEYEIQIQQINKEISNNKVNTICLFADKDYQFVSSSVVKEVFHLNKDLTRYLDPIVISKMNEKR